MTQVPATPELVERLREAALAVTTPGNIDSAPEGGEYGHKETGKWYACPACDGDGQVHGATYCNFDGKPLGVQFFGIGAEFQQWEDYFRAASPATVLGLIDKLQTFEAALTEIARLRTDLRGDFSMGSKQSDIARQALSSQGRREGGEG
ncbi:hypothetical protein [Phenylobacterium sp.]|uniref:hypothetical protein n=1 Tax=Phenylobacterium sp. TaxID=1871053 RepID=UPI0035AE2CD0